MKLYAHLPALLLSSLLPALYTPSLQAQDISLNGTWQTAGAPRPGKTAQAFIVPSSTASRPPSQA